MIVRIMGVGQFRLSDHDMAAVNAVDTRVEAAVEGGDEAGLQAALAELGAVVQRLGTPLADDEFLPSDVVVPDADTTLEEARQLLSEDGLIPG